jgi:maleamate amidohydrolase
MISGLTTSRSVRVSWVGSPWPWLHSDRGVREGRGDRHRPPHEADVFGMNAKYVAVISDQEALGYVASLQKGR